MDHAGRGAAALTASDAATAVVEYTHALISHPTSPDYFTQRSIAFSRVKPPRHDLALQDAELAALAGRKRGKRDKIQAGQQRRMISLYNLGRYADAKVVIDSLAKWVPENSKPKIMEHQMWKSKVEGKLKGNEDQTASVPAEPEGELPDEKQLKKFLQAQLKKDATFNYDGSQEAESTQQPAMTAPSTQTTADSAATQVNVSAGPPQKIRHEFFQSSNTVTLTIYAKNVPKDKADIEINSDSIHISFPHPSDPSTSFNLSFDPLYALIDTRISTNKIMSTKIEISLAKAEPGRKWPALEGDTPLPSNPKSTRPVAALLPQSTLQAPSYPTSSKTGPKNWDKLAADLTKKLKPQTTKAETEVTNETHSDGGEEGDDTKIDEDEEEFGGDAVDGFFKKLYKGSDPDTQRAMMKSFYESNGTTLSTNWDEVGKGYVKPYDERKKDDDD